MSYSGGELWAAVWQNAPPAAAKGLEAPAYLDWQVTQEHYGRCARRIWAKLNGCLSLLDELDAVQHERIQAAAVPRASYEDETGADAVVVDAAANARRSGARRTAVPTAATVVDADVRSAGEP